MICAEMLDNTEARTLQLMELTSRGISSIMRWRKLMGFLGHRESSCLAWG
jgi:hypothetical protein